MGRNWRPDSPFSLSGIPIGRHQISCIGQLAISYGGGWISPMQKGRASNPPQHREAAAARGRASPTRHYDGRRRLALVSMSRSSFTRWKRPLAKPRNRWSSTSIIDLEPPPFGPGRTTLPSSASQGYLEVSGVRPRSMWSEGSLRQQPLLGGSRLALRHRDRGIEAVAVAVVDPLELTHVQWRCAPSLPVLTRLMPGRGKAVDRVLLPRASGAPLASSLRPILMLTHVGSAIDAGVCRCHRHPPHDRRSRP